MNKLRKKDQLIYDRKDRFFLFQLKPDGLLSYRIFNGDMEVVKEHQLADEVLNYALCLDGSNRINLIYLLAGGELMLKIMDGDEWIDSQIALLDTKSNFYQQFELLHISNKLHFIFSASNYINSQLITIYHLIINKKIERKNVIKYVLRKDYCHFSLGYDDFGTIHLLYNTKTNFDSYIYYTFYSPYRGVWTMNPKEMSSRGKENSEPYLFVDSKSNIHALWLEEARGQYRVRLAKMAISGKDKYIWQYVNLNHNFNSCVRPLIYEMEGQLRLLCYDDKSIRSFSSRDFGDSWAFEGEKEIKNYDNRLKFNMAKDLHPGLKVEHLLAKEKVEGLADIYFAFKLNELKLVKLDHEEENNQAPSFQGDEEDEKRFKRFKLNYDINGLDEDGGKDRPNGQKNREAVTTAIDYDINPIVDKSLEQVSQELLNKEELKELILELLEDLKVAEKKGKIHQILQEVLEDTKDSLFNEVKTSLEEISERQNSILQELEDLKKVLGESRPSLMSKLFKT
ncbi:MAG: hypothetical protein GX185_04455 [Tissierellia bacterium]|nr:hypothetical protein [Tissierellia bacterium]